MKYILPLITTLSFTLVGCSSVDIVYPDSQTHLQSNEPASSALIVAKPAHEFTDNDIRVPANFATQGLDTCNFSLNNEVDSCPLKKKAIRLYFANNKTIAKDSTSEQALSELNNHQLELMLENQLAGINRFRIITKDETTTNQEKSTQLNQQDPLQIAKVMMEQTVLRPDYAIKIDTLKTADRFYAEYNGVARYDLEMTTSVINPYTLEKLSYPNVGKIRVQGTDVRDKESFVFTEVNEKYYTGFDYTDTNNINALFNSMVSRSFDILISRLLTEMPASAQVMAFRDGQATLDRGRNAGIFNGETMILFNYEQGFLDPIAVATVTPSKASSVAQIVRWKNNAAAEKIKKSAKGQIHAVNNQRIFAVSIGLPKSALKNRM